MERLSTLAYIETGDPWSVRSLSKRSPLRAGGPYKLRALLDLHAQLGGGHHPPGVGVRILPTEKRRRAGRSRVNERKEPREAAITSQVAADREDFRTT